ncbi:MAG TPA: hypothetical protein VII06_05250 [Chloroflexota bacterium]|jgi:hypothetical protein
MTDTHYSPVGARVLLENNHVRVWEVECGHGALPQPPRRDQAALSPSPAGRL